MHAFISHNISLKFTLLLTIYFMCLNTIACLLCILYDIYVNYKLMKLFKKEHIHNTILSIITTHPQTPYIKKYNYIPTLHHNSMKIDYRYSCPYYIQLPVFVMPFLKLFIFCLLLISKDTHFKVLCYRQFLDAGNLHSCLIKQNIVFWFILQNFLVTRSKLLFPYD